MRYDQALEEMGLNWFWLNPQNKGLNYLFPRILIGLPSSKGALYQGLGFFGHFFPVRFP